MAKLLARNATVSITDYGAVTGTPSAGSAVPIVLYARSVRHNLTTDNIDQTAIGDTVRSLLPGQNDIAVELECYVPSTGSLLYSLINHWVRVVIDPDGAGVTIGTRTIDGSVTAFSSELSVGESQIERVTIQATSTVFP